MNIKLKRDDVKINRIRQIKQQEKYENELSEASKTSLGKCRSQMEYSLLLPPLLSLTICLSCSLLFPLALYRSLSLSELFQIIWQKAKIIYHCLLIGALDTSNFLQKTIAYLLGQWLSVYVEPINMWWLIVFAIPSTCLMDFSIWKRLFVNIINSNWERVLCVAYNKAQKSTERSIKIS